MKMVHIGNGDFEKYDVGKFDNRHDEEIHEASLDTSFIKQEWGSVDTCQWDGIINFNPGCGTGWHHLQNDSDGNIEVTCLWGPDDLAVAIRVTTGTHRECCGEERRL